MATTSLSASGKTVTVALAGNPNTGKTTIFNNLTGARQHVGNYPGVTVEKKEGKRRHNGALFHIVDLPGAYSLSAHAVDELVARNYLIEENPDVVVNIVDASNLERNLYLTTQLVELGAPVVLALNMVDNAASRGIEIDIPKLSHLLGVPVVALVGTKNIGTDELLEAVMSVAAGRHNTPAAQVTYGEALEFEISAISSCLERSPEALKGKTRWQAIKLLEGDGAVLQGISSKEVVRLAQEGRERIRQTLGVSPELAVTNGRYGFIGNICSQAVSAHTNPKKTLAERLDAIVTHRLLGIPLFLGMMYLVFHLTFTLGGPPMEWIEEGIGWLAGAVSGLWPEGAESPLRSLLVDGVIGGVGNVLVFLPNILLLFLAIAILEDTGYMSRAAFIMDRLMHKIGLHGKSFIPFIIGFGCSIPAIMATRTLENRRDRLLTMLVVPLVSCGARLPIYALIIPAFFAPEFHSLMLWLIYLIGITLAVISAKVLSITLMKGDPAPFVMELPPYRLPTLKSVALQMWERARLYLVKAGTIILGISVMLWVLTSYPQKTVFDNDYDALAAQASAHLSGDQIEQRMTELDEMRQAEMIAYSVAGRIGHAIEPIIRPMGFDWKIGTALVGAVAAKEVFVAQLGVVYSVGEADETSSSLREQLRKNYSGLTAFCIMLFTLISAPCMATFAVTKRESNSWKWATFQFLGLTILAYVVTLAVYQAGSALNIGL